jgi:hypothetical protein
MSHGNMGKGRPKGSLNRTNKSVREEFERVFLQLQNHETAALLVWAAQNPSSFYALASKLLPASLNVGLSTGDLAERLISARRATGR